MSQQTELAKRIWTILSRPKPQLRKTYIERLDENNDTGIRFFSDFDLEHQKKSHGIFLEFDRIAKSKRDEISGITAVLDSFDEKINTENPDLVYYALRIFLTHGIDKFEFKLPSILLTNPELTLPSRKKARSQFEIAVGSPNETKLDWFREDPLLNEHHGHWHEVYNPEIEIDRQGEMFFYMHRQMLARYDAERHAAGLDQVIPFDDMEKPIAVGYAAGDDVRLSNAIGGGRPINASVDIIDAKDLKEALDLLTKDIDNGVYDPDITANNQMTEEISMSDFLGGIIEPNNKGRRGKNYFGYHSTGHMHIYYINYGVMGNTTTAIRDVIFWEWHKGIDNIYEQWIKRLSPHGVFADAPPVALRKFTDDDNRQSTHDLILCHTKDIEGFNIVDGNDIGQKAFGNGNWENDFRSGNFIYDDNGVPKNIKTTVQLQTKMNKTKMKYTIDNEEHEYTYEYLTHEPFCYFIRVQNNSLEQKQVTVRLFMVPAEFEESHEKWIEMDKFLHELPPDSKHVIFRSDEQSSVVRKPVVKDLTMIHTTFDPVNMEIDPQKCNCGWPYHMLLPKGKKEDDGMKFRLMVMITDGNIDSLGNEPDCGSLSFCGAKNNAYPDQRPLGYPFNRLFEGNGKSITNAITQNNNMACRDIFIKHVTI